MAKYLITIRAKAAAASRPQLAVPADYMVEWVDDAALGDSGGLEQWRIDVQIAGALTDWAKADAFAHFWDYVDQAVVGRDVRPGALVAIHARADPKRVRVALAYLGDQQLKKARDSLHQKITAETDPGTRRLKHDIEITL